MSEPTEEPRPQYTVDELHRILEAVDKTLWGFEHTGVGETPRHLAFWALRRRTAQLLRGETHTPPTGTRL